MRQLTISGKPHDLQETAATPDAQFPSMFVLNERYYRDGQAIQIEWAVYVPRHKTAFVQKMVEKGYTVMVVASDFGIRIHGAEQALSENWLVLSDLLIP